jgi:hypothetical protein
VAELFLAYLLKPSFLLAKVGFFCLLLGRLGRGAAFHMPKLFFARLCQLGFLLTKVGL